MKTAMKFNGGSWSEDQKIYLKEIDGPASYPDLRGIVFSTNFGKSNFATYTYTAYNLNVYYLPYRNLNQITCNSSGWNRAQTSDGTTSYDIWLDVWESECNTIANYLDANRRSRQATLSTAASNFATYGTDYVTNLSTYESLVAGGKTLTSQISTLSASLLATDSDIAKYTKLSSDTGASVATEQITLSTMQAKSSTLQALISSNNAQKLLIQASLDSLKAQGTSAATSKDTYTKSATDAMTAFNLYLDALKIEAVQDATTLTTISSAKTSLDSLNSDDAKTKINSIIPN